LVSLYAAALGNRIMPDPIPITNHAGSALPRAREAMRDQSQVVEIS
jgi:hypothetical protein